MVIGGTMPGKTALFRAWRGLPVSKCLDTRLPTIGVKHVRDGSSFL